MDMKWSDFVKTAGDAVFGAAREAAQRRATKDRVIRNDRKAFSRAFDNFYLTNRTHMAWMSDYMRALKAGKKAVIKRREGLNPNLGAPTGESFKHPVEASWPVQKSAQDISRVQETANRNAQQ